MAYYGKGFNDGDDAPIFVREGDKRVKDFLPVGEEDKYIITDSGYILKEDYKKMQKEKI